MGISIGKPVVGLGVGAGLGVLAHQIGVKEGFTAPEVVGGAAATIVAGGFGASYPEQGRNITRSVKISNALTGALLVGSALLTANLLPQR